MVGKAAVVIATKFVVAICVLAVPSGALGAVGTPVKAALNFSLCTKAVVAILAELSLNGAVGAVGVPVKIGLIF